MYQPLSGYDAQPRSGAWQQPAPEPCCSACAENTSHSFGFDPMVQTPDGKRPTREAVHTGAGVAFVLGLLGAMVKARR